MGNVVRMDELEEQSEDDTGKVLKYHEKDVLKINVYKNRHLIYFSCIK